jgi:transposase
MIRMLLVGYAVAIRSEHRLCEEVHLNLAYRWFCRLGFAINSSRQSRPKLVVCAVPGRIR